MRWSCHWQATRWARLRAMIVLSVVATVVASMVMGGTLAAWLPVHGPNLSGGSLQPPGEPGAPVLAAAKKGRANKQHKGKNRSDGKGKRKGPKHHEDKDQPGKHKGDGKAKRKGDKKGKSKKDEQPQERVAAAAAPLALVAVADARVSEAKPTSNYGNSTQLLVDGGGADPDVASYLRFDVSGVSGAVQQATLRLWVQPDGGTADGPEVRAVGAGWTEGGLTWNTRPAATSGALDDKGKLNGGAWVEYNVTAAVRGDGPVAFVLLPQTNDGAVFDSREAANRPQLLIAAGSGTPSPTPTPSPSPTPPPSPTPTPSGSNISFPVRAAFYYPWFPHAWQQGSIYPYTNYQPSLGYYDGGTEATIQQHIAAMQYGRISMGIASWWGIGHHTDARIPSLLAAAAGTNFRWALYYEQEGTSDPSIDQIRADLTYIRDQYASDPNYARVDGKFVVFVYNADDGDCAVATRWKQANTVGAYVVLKAMSGYRNCANQPESWHQYAPAAAADRQAGYSYSISPGFWQYGQGVRLQRDLSRWQQNVRDMVASGAPWQLVTTFNEWGEGTSVESAVEWKASSGYGAYLDALHQNGQPSG